MKKRDIMFIGGGYRTTSFLARHPEIIENNNVTIVEQGNRIGGGAFRQYNCTSTSIASRFYSGIDSRFMNGEVGEFLSKLNIDGDLPAYLPEVAKGLDIIGKNMLTFPQLELKLNSEVKEIDVKHNEVVVTIGDGTNLSSDHVVVATGRQEIFNSELDLWHKKVILSSTLISTSYEEKLCDEISRPDAFIVIVGASHSAAAVSLLINKCARKMNIPYPKQKILVRNGIRLNYKTLQDAHNSERSSWEAGIDELSSVCPDTLQVNRDSGLRGDGRQLFVNIMNGSMENISFERVSKISDAHYLLSNATLIVQATGYNGRAPGIRLPNGLYREPDSTERIWNLPDGTAVIDHTPLKNVSFLRLEPTPEKLRDHAQYGQQLYSRLAQRLMMGD